MGIAVNAAFKTILWQQFGAAIDMLEDAIEACPERLWSDSRKKPAGDSISGVGFWYIAYHTLFWFDFYLSEPEEKFTPPAPFDLSEFEAGRLPERAYTKAELQGYLDHGRKKCKDTIDALTDEKANQRRHFSWGEISGAELLLYNMRHVQHHTAQLNLMLRQAVNAAPRWLAKAKVSLNED
jgi:uncharacterized damage-inducible protein DinB